MKRAALAAALTGLLVSPAWAQVRPLAPTVAAPIAPLTGAPPAATGPLKLAPVPLPAPPLRLGAANQTLLAAMLAIAQAQRIDPQTAGTAAFAYVQAVQQYRSGDIASADRNAQRALSIANGAQVERAVPAPASSAASATAAMASRGIALLGATAPEVDADSFLALARGQIADCAARHDRRVGTARAAYARAEVAFTANDWEAARSAAKAAIDACATPRP